jgi:hypothetical protein
MNNNLVRIDIIDNESLLKACDILHDAYFDLSTVEYDENNGIWKAIFEREYFENSKTMQTEQKFLFLTKVTFPLAKSELSLGGIKTYKIEDRSNIRIYSFNECQVKKHIYKFLFNEDMEITITFQDKPKGSLVDQELLDKKGSYYRWSNPFKRK